MIEPYVSIGINLKQINDAVPQKNYVEEGQIREDVKLFCERCNGSNCNRFSTCILLREENPLILVNEFCSQAICNGPEFCKKSCPLRKWRASATTYRSYTTCSQCGVRLFKGRNWSDYLEKKRIYKCKACFNMSRKTTALQEVNV